MQAEDRSAPRGSEPQGRRGGAHEAVGVSPDQACQVISLSGGSCVDNQGKSLIGPHQEGA